MSKEMSENINENKKEEKPRDPVFVESDPQEPFPQDAVEALRKEIRKLARDLSEDWASTTILLNRAFENLSVPVPTANLEARWDQYKRLIRDAVIALRDSRGFGARWSIL